MNDHLSDEVPLPHFENELWPTLAQVHAEQHRIATPSVGAPEVVDARARRHARRHARRLVVTGVAAVAAAVFAMVMIVVTDPDRSPDREALNAEVPDTDASDGTPTTGAPKMSLAAHITAATEEATESSIIHTITDNQYDADDGTAIGDNEMWTDEQSGAMRNLDYDSEGRPSFDSGLAAAPGVDDPGPPPIPPGAAPTDPSLPQQRVRQVDHCFGEYVEYDQVAIPGHNEAERIGQWLDEGKLVEDGTEIVDGRELIRLVQVPVELLPSTGGGRDELSWTTTTIGPATDPSTTTTDPSTTTTDAGALDPDTFEYVEHIYLVDAETFQPVRIIGYPGGAPDYSDATYVATIEYLPRTPENMALLSSSVPDGFELVANLRGDGARYDECGW
jgi:hypothetical protein